MKNVIKRIITGILATGFLSATAIGLATLISMIFEDGPAWLRIVTAVIFVGSVWVFGKGTSITVGESDGE